MVCVKHHASGGIHFIQCKVEHLQVGRKVGGKQENRFAERLACGKRELFGLRFGKAACLRFQYDRHVCINGNVAVRAVLGRFARRYRLFLVVRRYGRVRDESLLRLRIILRAGENQSEIPVQSDLRASRFACLHAENVAVAALRAVDCVRPYERVRLDFGECRDSVAATLGRRVSEVEPVLRNQFYACACNNLVVGVAHRNFQIAVVS